MRVHIEGLGRRRSETTRAGLAVRGFTVSSGKRLEQLESARWQPDAVLLDCGRVDVAAVSYCHRLRQVCAAPIVAATERVDNAAWLRGREAGIDDFLVEPFGVEELAVRLRLSIRPARVGGAEARCSNRIVCGPLEIDEDSLQVSVHGRRIELRPKEYRLLVVLARQAGMPLGRELLVAKLWPSGWDGAGHALEVHVAALRAKLGVPGMIATVRGVGYRLVPQESRLELIS